MPKCPVCNGVLEQITYPRGSMFNRDQWQSMIAGDWICHTCPGNGRGRDTSVCYWWDAEVKKGEQKEKHNGT